MKLPARKLVVAAATAFVFTALFAVNASVSPARKVVGKAESGVEWRGNADHGEIVWRHVGNGGKRLAFDLPPERYTHVSVTNTITLMYCPPAEERYVANSQNRCDGWFYVSREQAGTWRVRARYDDYIGVAFDGKWLVTVQSADKALAWEWPAKEGWHKFTVVFGDTGGSFGSVGMKPVPYAVAIKVNGGEYLPFEKMVGNAAEKEQESHDVPKDGPNPVTATADERPAAAPVVAPVARPVATPTPKPAAEPASKPTPKPVATPASKPTPKPAEAPKAKPAETDSAATTELPPIKIWTTEEASDAMKFDRMGDKKSGGIAKRIASRVMKAVRKPSPKRRSLPLTSPAADDGFLDGISPRGAIANMREMIREIVGPLDGADEALFEAKWNAVMDFPSEPIVEWLKKASPIASEMVRIKNYVNEAMSDYTDAVDEANRACMFGAFEDAERLMGEAEDIAQSMLSAKERMAELKAKLEELGEMPDPVEEKKAAAEQRKAAEKTMRDLFGGTVETKIGGWYEIEGKVNYCKLPGPSGKVASKVRDGDSDTQRWRIFDPSNSVGTVASVWIREKIYIRPLAKMDGSGAVILYVNEYDDNDVLNADFNGFETEDGGIDIYKATGFDISKAAKKGELPSMKVTGVNRVSLRPFVNSKGESRLLVQGMTYGKGGGCCHTAVYRPTGGADLEMLPGATKPNLVEFAKLKEREDPVSKAEAAGKGWKADRKRKLAESFAKIRTDPLDEAMKACREYFPKAPISGLPKASDVYYVLSGMEPVEVERKPQTGTVSAYYEPTDRYFREMCGKLESMERGTSWSAEGTSSSMIQLAMFRCDLKRVAEVFGVESRSQRKQPLDHATAEVHLKWGPPSMVLRADDGTLSMALLHDVTAQPFKHAKFVQSVEVRGTKKNSAGTVFSREYKAGAKAKDVLRGNLIANGWGDTDPEETFEFHVDNLAGGEMCIRCRYVRTVLTEDEAAQLAEDMSKKFADAMRKEWSSQEFGEAAKQVDAYLAELEAGEDAVSEAVAAEDSQLARQKENKEFHDENIKFIDGTISRLKAEAAKEKDESRRRALEWQIVCEESNKIHEQDLIRAGETGEFHASRTPFDTMCRMQVLESAVKEVQSDRIMRQEQERIYAFTRSGSQFKLTDEQKRRVEEAMDKVDRSDPLKAALAYRRISDNLLKSDVNSTMGRAAMLDDEILGYEDLLLRAQRVKMGCDIAIALGGIAISGGVAAGELAPIMATKFNVIKYTYAMGCGYAESGPMGIIKGAVSTYSDAVDIIWSGVDSYQEAVKARRKGDKDANPVLAFAKGAGWSLFLNKGIPKVMEKVNWRKKITFSKSQGTPPKIDVDSPDVKAYKAEVENAKNEISAYVEAKNKINTMSEFDLASGKITDAQISMLRGNVVKAAAKINSNPTAKAILKYDQGYGKIGQDFNLELGRIHSAVKAEFYKDMAAKGFDGLRIKSIRNASSGKSVGMDADWGIDETVKITRNGKPVSAYECMTEGQKSWNAKYEKVTGQKAKLSWENVTSHAHPEAYRNMEILKANGADAKMRDLLRRTSLSDAQQIADVSRFKADEMLNSTDFPRLVYVREAARGSAKDLGGKFLPAIDAKMKPLVRLEGMVGKHGKALSPAQSHELNRLRAAREYYGRVQKVFDDIGKGKIPPSEWDAKINEITGGRGISDTLGDLGDLFKSLVIK